MFCPWNSSLSLLVCFVRTRRPQTVQVWISFTPEQHKYPWSPCDTESVDGWTDGWMEGKMERLMDSYNTSIHSITSTKTFETFIVWVHNTRTFDQLSSSNDYNTLVSVVIYHRGPNTDSVFISICLTTVLVDLIWIRFLSVKLVRGEKGLFLNWLSY